VKKLIVIVLALFILAGTVVGCGGDKKPAGGGQTPSGEKK